MVLDLSKLGEVTIAVRPDRTAIVPTRQTHPAHGCTTFAITVADELADELGRRYANLVDSLARELAVQGSGVVSTVGGIPPAAPTSPRKKRDARARNLAGFLPPQETDE